jgi:hypothetical protein
VASLTVGRNITGGSTVASLGVLANVRFSLAPPFSGERAPLRYAWDVGGLWGITHGLNDSSRSGTIGATARYGRGTNFSGPRVSLGASFAAFLNPSVDASGVETTPFTASATGILEVAISNSVTWDFNLVGSGTFGGGSTTYTGVNFLNTGTVGAQTQFGIDLGHRWTLTPEAVLYGTFGSGAPAGAGLASPFIESLRVGGGPGISRRFGPLRVPSAILAIQADGFFETTNSRLGGTTTNFQGAGAIVNVGFTLDTTHF